MLGRSRSLLFVLSAAAITHLLMPASQGAAQTLPSLTLSLNQITYRPGDTMVLTATMTPGATAHAVDAYIVLKAPDGSVFSLLADRSLVPGLVPIAKGFVPVPFSGEALRFIMDANVPTGSYAWFAGITDAGTPDVIGLISERPFTVTHTPLPSPGPGPGPDPVPVPVPPTLLLLAAGVLGTAGLARYRRRSR